MSIDGQNDIEALQKIGAVVAEARDAMGKAIRAGISTADLDEVARKVLEKHGARSAPILAYKFPGTTCISVNDELAHGIPSSQKILQEGDIVNVDVSAELNGYWADTGASFPVGSVSEQALKLLKATREALDDALEVATAGRLIRELGKRVQKRAKKNGFRVVRNICGHGVGRFIHEEPSIPNVFDARDDRVFEEGMVLAIEPFLTTSATTVIEDRDGWTLRTPDRSIGAQFEHTVIVTQHAPIVVTI